MKVVKIRVTAAQTVPNPRVSFANFKPEITIEAELQETDSLGASVEYLQRTANELLDAEIERLLK